MVDSDSRIVMNLKSSGCALIYASILALIWILRFRDPENMTFVFIMNS